MVDAGRLRAFVERAQTFALEVWKRIDPGHDVREAAIALAVPEASYKVYAETDVGGSMSMPMRMPTFSSRLSRRG